MTDEQLATNTAGLADELYDRWCRAVGEDHREESEWLAEISRSLRRAARAFGSTGAIG